MTDDIRAIREALEAGPTPGPWSVYWGRGGTYPLGIATKTQNIVTAIARPASDEGCANAKLMAACNPTAIASILAHVEVVEKERDALRAALQDCKLVAKSHMDMAVAMGAKEKARTAASILAEIEARTTP